MPNSADIPFSGGWFYIRFLEGWQSAAADFHHWRHGGPYVANAPVCDWWHGCGGREAHGRIGAWIGPWLTLWAFLSSAIAGAVIAAGMIVYSGALYRHLAMMHTIGHEVLTIRNPGVLSERARERKPTMNLFLTPFPSRSARSGFSRVPGC